VIRFERLRKKDDAMHLTFAKPLPGNLAHLEMAPPHRTDSMRKEPFPPPGAVDAAVLVLLTPTNLGRSLKDLLQWKVLLIRRTSDLNAHSGQISFPGGRCETSDSGLYDTACREAYEEAGINRDQLDLVGSLTSIYVLASNFAVHPFLAVSKKPQPVRLNPREAVSYRNIPVQAFNPERSVCLDFEYPGGRHPAPAWQCRGFTIWGATAMILTELYRMVENMVLVRQ